MPRATNDLDGHGKPLRARSYRDTRRRHAQVGDSPAERHQFPTAQDSAVDHQGTIQVAGRAGCDRQHEKRRALELGEDPRHLCTPPLPRHSKVFGVNGAEAVKQGT